MPSGIRSAALAREGTGFAMRAPSHRRVACGAGHSVGTIPKGSRGRADAAILPGQSLHHAGTSLRHFCLPEIPTALPPRACQYNSAIAPDTVGSLLSTSASYGCTSFCRSGSQRTCRCDRRLGGSSLGHVRRGQKFETAGAARSRSSCRRWTVSLHDCTLSIWSCRIYAVRVRPSGSRYRGPGLSDPTHSGESGCSRNER